MASIARRSGPIGAGLIVLGIGIERLVSAILTDALASYASTRFVVAVACTATGSALLALGMATHWRTGMTWLKPGIWGFVIGSLATMIIGFSWGGWTTSGTVERLAADRATAATNAALVSVCLEKSKADPDGAKKLRALQALTSVWDQRDAVAKDGWATVGAGEANTEVAEACAAQLTKVAEK